MVVEDFLKDNDFLNHEIQSFIECMKSLNFAIDNDEIDKLFLGWCLKAAESCLENGK